MSRVTCFFSTSALRFLFFFREKKKAKKKEEEKPERCADATPLREATKIQKKHSETGDPISTAEKDFFFIIQKKKKKIFLCDSLVGCSILDFFLLKKEKKKKNSRFREIAAETLVEQKLDAAYNSNANRIFSARKRGQQQLKKIWNLFLSLFFKPKRGGKKTFTFFLLFQTNKKKKTIDLQKLWVAPALISFDLFLSSKKEKRFKTERGGSCANWDLVDSASSHMLVSRTKPCMPQNNCIAGICAWLITSDVICRNSFAVSALLDNLAKRQANTWTSANLLGVLLRMNEIKTNAADAAATQQCWLNSFRAKAGLPASFDEQLPYQLVLAV